MIHFLHSAFEFLVFTVIVKMIVGGWIAKQILKYTKDWLAKNERYWAIFLHYQHQAAGAGHTAGSVLHCTQEKCVIF